MEDGGTCRYINVESATAYWRGAGRPNPYLDYFSVFFDVKSMIICVLGLGSGYFLTWWVYISHMHVSGCELLIV